MYVFVSEDNMLDWHSSWNKVIIVIIIIVIEIYGEEVSLPTMCYYDI